MRRLLALGVFYFVFSSHHIDPQTFLPNADAWAFAPANSDLWTERGFIADAVLAQPEAGSAESVTPETRGQQDAPVSKDMGADRTADQPAQRARRKVSVAEMCDTVVSAAQANDLPVGFLIRLIWQESGFDSSIVSRAGAQGVAQFMPRVAAEWGLRDPFDPLQALPASARLLRFLHQQFGNLGLAAAAYNAGSGRIQNWLSKRGKLPEETRSYVMNVTGHAADQWVKTAPNSVSFRIPARAPCQEIAARSDAETIPLPPRRVTAPAIVASALASVGKIAAAAKAALLPSRAAGNNGKAPVPIMTAAKAGGSKISLVTGTPGKRQQLILPVKLAAKSPAKERMHLAIMTPPAREKRAGKSVGKNAAKKSLAKGRIQLAMATRSLRK
jgi:hypothetical protein